MRYELCADISVHQTGDPPKPIDFFKMRDAGAKCVWIRKHSGYYRDIAFELNWEGAGAVPGLERSFYSVPYVGYDFGRQWTALTTRKLADGSIVPFDPIEADRPGWCDVEYRHPLPMGTAVSLLLEWMHAMKEWGGQPDVYTAKYVWQDYYSKAKGWGEDWDLIAANYREGWYGLPVSEMTAKAVAAGDPLTPIGWEYTKQGVLVPVRERWQGWQFAADRNQLGSTFGVLSRDIDLSIQRVEDDPEPEPPAEPPTDISAWLGELRAAHATTGHVIAEFPG
jgi:hypothetical protein